MSTSIPFPVIALKLFTYGTSIESSFAFSRMPFAMGCSEFCSNAAAIPTISYSSKPDCKDMIRATSNFSIVSLPD